MVASEIPSTMSLCVRSFLRSTISFCTTEIRAMNPPNAVLPILRKLKNRDHREGPSMKGGSLFSRLSVALLFTRLEVAEPFEQVEKCLRGRFPETVDSYFFQDGRTAFGRFESH